MLIFSVLIISCFLQAQPEINNRNSKAEQKTVLSS